MYGVSHLLVDLGWFDNLAQLPSRFCPIPISPGRILQTVEHHRVNPTRSMSRWDTLYNYILF